MKDCNEKTCEYCTVASNEPYCTFYDMKCCDVERCFCNDTSDSEKSLVV